MLQGCAGLETSSTVFRGRRGDGRRGSRRNSRIGSRRDSRRDSRGGTRSMVRGRGIGRGRGVGYVNSITTDCMRLGKGDCCTA